MALVANECRPTCRCRMGLCLLVRGCHLVHLRPHVGDGAKRSIGDAEREVVAGCLEGWQRLGDERLQRIGSAPRLKRNAQSRLVDPPAQLADDVAHGSRALDERRRAAQGLLGLRVPGERVDEVRLEGEVNLRRHQFGGALEEPRGAAEIQPAERTPASGGQTLSRCHREPLVLTSQLSAVVDGLLEVVAEKLVQLDDGGPVLLEPPGEASVEVRTCSLRQSVVGCVADQEVAEAEAVLAGDLRLVRSDQLLADECREARRYHRLVQSKRLNCAAVEDLSLDRSALQDGPLGLLQLVEARRKQCLEGRWDDHLTVVLPSHRQDLADVQRVPSGRPRDPPAQGVTDPSRHEQLDILGRQRLQLEQHRPPGAPLGQLGAAPCKGAKSASRTRAAQRAR